MDKDPIQDKDVIDLTTDTLYPCNKSSSTVAIPVTQYSVENCSIDSNNQSYTNGLIDNLHVNSSGNQRSDVDMFSEGGQLLSNDAHGPVVKRRRIHMNEESCFSHQKSEEGVKPLCDPLQMSLSSSSTPKKYLIPRPGRLKSKPADGQLSPNTGGPQSSRNSINSSSVSASLVTAFQNNAVGGFGKASNMYDITRTWSSSSGSSPNAFCRNNSMSPLPAKTFSSKLKSNSRSSSNQAKITDSFKKCISQSEQAEIDALYTRTSPTVLYSPLKRISGSIYLSEDSCSPTISNSPRSNIDIRDNPVVKQLFQAQKTLTSDTKPKQSRNYPQYAQQNKWNQNKGTSETKSNETSQNAFDEEMNDVDDKVISQALDKANTYGLFGSVEHEDKTNYFDLLPDEVVENILCHLPMLDLCLNSNRVCVRWSNIISSDKVYMCNFICYRYLSCIKSACII